VQQVFRVPMSPWAHRARQAGFFQWVRCRDRAQWVHMIVYGSMYCLLVARARYACRPTNPNPKMNLDTAERRLIIANHVSNDAPGQGLSFAVHTTPRGGVCCKAFKKFRLRLTVT
jgi:hypothetical protein